MKENLAPLREGHKRQHIKNLLATLIVIAEGGVLSGKRSSIRRIQTDVKTRLIINRHKSDAIRFFEHPFFDHLHGSTVRQGALRNMVVVSRQIAHEGDFQFLCGGKTGLLEEFLDATVHALDHAIGLRMARRNQAVSDLALGACPVERMRAAGFFIGSEETIGEWRAIVGEDGFDASGAGFAQGIQKSTAFSCV
jgi:hypothetical protein